MRHDWDEAKRQSNVQKHGIDFADVEQVFEGETITLPDERFDYGEQRFITFGLLDGRVIAVAHTETEEVIRIISARKGDRA